MKFFLPAIIFLSIYFNAASQNTFQKVIGGSNGKSITGIQENNDGGLILSGVTDGWTGNSFLIKTDSNGDTLWTRIYMDSTLDVYGPYLAKTFDGGYIFTGYKYNAGIFVIKTDSIGNVIWSKVISGGDPEVKSIITLSDSAYLLVGQFFNTISQDIFLIKLDQYGDTLWTRAYGGHGTNYGTSIDEANDGGIIIGGYRYGFGSPFEEYYIIKTDSNGNVEWSRTFWNNQSPSFCYSVMKTLDRGYVLGGSDGIIKVDSSGNLNWKRMYPYSGLGYKVIQTLDSGFIEIGYTYDSVPNTYIFILKMDESGNYEWSKGVNGCEQGQESFRSPIIQSNDSGFIFSGFRYSPGLDSSGMYLVKTDKLGNSICNEFYIQIDSVVCSLQQSNVTTNIFSTIFSIYPINYISGHIDSVLTLCNSSSYTEEVNDRNNQFSIFPNPTEGQFTVSSRSISLNEIQIYNLWGQVVYSSKPNPNAESTTINCNHFPKGIYFVKATSISGTAVKKIVIE
jgi:photosystem II stability/assembly factor-like uncharacterized protein